MPADAPTHPGPPDPAPAAAPPHDLIVIHLAGGNDYLNTVVPYDDPAYHRARPTLALHPDGVLPVLRRPGRPDAPPSPAVLPIDEQLGFHGSLGPLAEAFDVGEVAVLLGVGYPDRDRSHFRSLDIWHTAEPIDAISEGWLGRTAARLDPDHDNPVLLTNVGRAMPLAMAAPGVMAASLESIDAYGLFPDASDTDASDGHGSGDDASGAGGAARPLADLAAGLYAAHGLPSPWAVARDVGTSALQGIAAFAGVPDRGPDDVTYPPFNPLAQRLDVVARIAGAGVGARIFHVAHAGYDTHEDQLATQQRLLAELAEAVEVFREDMARRAPDRDPVILVHSEFGRRIAESRGGTDHGGAGVAFLIGRSVRGGLHGDPPSLRPQDTFDGDLAPTIDLRQVYTAVLEQFLGVDATAVLPSARHGLDLRIPRDLRQAVTA